MGGEVDRAADALAAGQLVLYPTDTLYGLAASATDASAVDRLLAAKDRPAQMPISVAVSSLEEIEPLVTWTEQGRALARQIVPGPVTLLVRGSARARRSLAPPLIGPDGTIGIRVPDHPIARELARRAGPLTATSANRHGEPPAASIGEARRGFGDRIAVYLDLGPAPSGRPSTLVDLRGGTPRFVERR